MRSAERGFWWYAGLRQMLRLAVAAADLGPTPRVLDAGCGTGGNLRLLRELRPGARLTGLDFSSRALDELEPGLCERIVRADLNDAPDLGGAFDLIVCCDVLSHRGLDWRAALRYFERSLRPGGRLLLNVPAFPWLRGSHDAAVRVEHRFRQIELAKALATAGFGDVDLRYWNAALLPVVFAVRRWSLLRSGGRIVGSDLPAKAEPSSAGLRRWVEWEARWAFRRRLPFGTSLFACAVKRP